ncbi:AI-2E family transporter [Candidatus Gottesmanbacteria bacterium]|nr:AI-2E family transporter [Candidatus Gottesmanbacteria bacterium]
MKTSYVRIIAFFGFLFSLQLLVSFHGVLAPFLLAGIVSYIFHPLVVYVTKKTNISRFVVVGVLYAVVISFLFIASSFVGSIANREARELGFEMKYVTAVLERERDTAPEWLKPSMDELVLNIRNGTFLPKNRLWPYFTGALSGIGSVLVFLIATFYFLKDGELISSQFTRFLPSFFHNEEERKHIREILGNYLRGQLFLVFLMGSVSWIALSILGVKYAFFLGVFTGIAETVPLIGPIVAGALASLVAIFDGASKFSVLPLYEGFVVAIVYLVLRQLEDIFIIPYVLGRTMKLHPILVLFSVLLGGHVWGILGMVLAIPAAALARIVWEHEW